MSDNTAQLIAFALIILLFVIFGGDPDMIDYLFMDSLCLEESPTVIS